MFGEKLSEMAHDFPATTAVDADERNKCYVSVEQKRMMSESLCAGCTNLRALSAFYCTKRNDIHSVPRKV